VFVHRRGPDRAFLPGGWDVIGGHVESGEALLVALARELEEETGWRLVGEPALAYVGDWILPGDRPRPHREFDFVVEVEGDLYHPRLEWPKQTEFRWLGADDLDLLDENRGADDGTVRHLVEIALRSADPGRLTTPHAGLFLAGPLADRIEALRSQWDPAMAWQVDAHVTVAYPGDVEGLDELIRRSRRAAIQVGPVHLQLAGFELHGGPDDGLFVGTVDVNGDWARLRRVITGDSAPTWPHVTVVHPRTTNRSAQAWNALRSTPLEGELTVGEVSITAFDSRRWRHVERVPLSAGRAESWTEVNRGA
jgi:8-oxo-dGTP diphosphatase